MASLSFYFRCFLHHFALVSTSRMFATYVCVSSLLCTFYIFLGKYKKIFDFTFVYLDNSLLLWQLVYPEIDVLSFWKLKPSICLSLLIPTNISYNREAGYKLLSNHLKRNMIWRMKLTKQKLRAKIIAKIKTGF